MGCELEVWEEWSSGLILRNRGRYIPNHDDIYLQFRHRNTKSMIYLTWPIGKQGPICLYFFRYLR
jgi:hypothetical protein